MKNFATALTTCLLLSACNQGQQGQQQQAYVPSQQYNSQQPQQQQYQQPQQQQLQQAVPAAPPAAQQVAAPSHAHRDWAGNWSDGEGAELLIELTKPGKYFVQMNVGEGYEGYLGYDSGRSIVATRTTRTIEISATKVPFRDDGIAFTECLSVKGITDFCR